MNVTETVTNYEALTAEELVAAVVREAAGAPVCLTSSFQTEDMVVLHLLRMHLPDVPVIFLETGYHFKEVLAYRDRMTAEWGLNLINALPLTTVKEHEANFGLLYIVQPTECCRIRKVEPPPTRAGLKKIEDHKTPTGKRMKKVSVLADWTMAQVDAYAKANAIPKLELYARGYTSIGCEPCTAVPDDPANPRAGRWGGKKLECGIHTFSEKL
jgi:phosphoadenosine phosphosulfate reductase